MLVTPRGSRVKAKITRNQYTPSPECLLKWTNSCIPFSEPQYFHLTSSADKKEKKMAIQQVGPRKTEASEPNSTQVPTRENREMSYSI